MITSIFICCDDCQTQYRVRYGVGNNFPQKTTFNCSNCIAPISLGLKSRKEGFIIKGATSIKGEPDDSKELIVQNVHPEILIEKESENDSFYFPTISELMKFSKKADIFEFRKTQKDWTLFCSTWDKIQIPLRILSSKSEAEMHRICQLKTKDLTKRFENWSNLFLSGKWSGDFDKIVNDYEENKSLEMLSYFKANTQKWVSKILELCKSYMTYREHFDSTILYQKLNAEIEKNTISNVDWDKIKTVYGDLYELVGDFFIIPTAINNIQNHRNFDEFATEGFTFAKYIATDKANRGKNFKDNPASSFFLNSYYPWLRNGTHHKNCIFISEKNLIQLGTGKGGKNMKDVPIVEYIFSCNELFATGLCLSNVILRILKEEI